MRQAARQDPRAGRAADAPPAGLHRRRRAPPARRAGPRAPRLRQDDDRQGGRRGDGRLLHADQRTRDHVEDGGRVGAELAPRLRGGGGALARDHLHRRAGRHRAPPRQDAGRGRAADRLAAAHADGRPQAQVAGGADGGDESSERDRAGAAALWPLRPRDQHPGPRRGRAARHPAHQDAQPPAVLGRGSRAARARYAGLLRR
mmetsp:Transcript_23571/g.54557  ORF Transcript_23571/g.54557 Transcript_23571/m.54557 type:complete len:202 (+) Transcript_23571:706-1311(+)